MQHIAIIGFGRFGELLSGLLKPNYTVVVIESHPDRMQLAEEQGYQVADLPEIADCDTVIFAVPISEIENVVATAAPYISDKHLVMDICSVKVYPARVMRKLLPAAKIIATHPLFGPDSASRGLSGLQVAVCPVAADDATVQEVVTAWEKIGVDVVMSTPEEHDRDSVYSQAFTYSVARVILNMQLPNITFTTRSYRAITEVAHLSANDSQQLFHDMLYYNPYFPEMKAKLLESMKTTQEILQTIETEQHQSAIFN